MKKRWLFIVLLLQAGSCLFAQTIVQWNFNNSNLTPSAGTGTQAASINLIGVNSSYVSGVNLDPGNPNNALNTTNYPAQGTGAKTKGIQINFSTVNYNSIQLSLFSQHSNTAANTVVLQYFSGGSWVDITSYVVTASGTYYAQSIPLSGIPALNNNPNVQLRLVTDFVNGGTNYQATNYNNGSTYGTTGTIRYDLITITGNSTACGTLATQQASGFRLLKTDNSSAQLTLNRGDGTGCMVLCSAGSTPSTAPVNGTTYTASSIYGSGDAIGNAFAVYNTQAGDPSIHYFNINGLTAGTKYYLAAYEYSSAGPCYLIPGTVDSFYCNSTILYPGDVQFVGFDNYIATGGADAYSFTNLKPIKKGTSFQIVNSRYEAGAAANVRTQRWYGGNNTITNDLEVINILYTATTPLPVGSIISFEFDGNSSINSIKVGNVTSNAFTITSNAINSLLNSGNNPDPEQLFLTQGKFTQITEGSDTYSLLEGHVLHGISSGKAWVDFSQACSAATTTRESRLPPDIKCLNVAFTTTGDYGYYQTSALHNSGQGSLLGQLANRSNWSYGNGANGNDISTTYTAPFNITTASMTANWTGGADGNWFNCSNWENLYVPDSTATVSVAATPVAGINNNATSAIEYGGLAMVRNLNIASTVTLSGNSADKLIVYDSLIIGSTGTLTTSGTAIDTIVIRGSIQNLNTDGLQLKTNGWLSLQGNRQIQPINVSLARTVTPDSVMTLSLNNPPGININTGGFESLQKLELANGILSPAASAFHYLGTGCTISSPISNYGSGEPNIGWEKSYIDGKVSVRTNSIADYMAPLGSKQKGVFTPMMIHPSTATPFVYEAGYIGMSHPNTSAADINNPPIYKVSTQEYWTLVCNPYIAASSAAKLTLYYTPLSFVGGQGPDSAALRDLRIVQYRDTTMGPRKWRLPSSSNMFPPAGPNTQYGKVTIPSGEFAFSLIDIDKCFTLGSTSFLNTLPLQVVRWAAQLQGSRTLLSWQVRQEAGTAFYTIEKSGDGKTFHPLQTVYAAGLPAYACFDDTPADGWNYYRLKIMDANGKGNYTTIEKVWLKHIASFTVFPNPASDKLFISLSSTAKATIRLYTPDGRKCTEQTTATTSFTSLSVKGLPAGWYLLEYTDGKNRLTQKVMVK